MYAPENSTTKDGKEKKKMTGQSVSVSMPTTSMGMSSATDRVARKTCNDNVKDTNTSSVSSIFTKHFIL